MKNYILIIISLVILQSCVSTKDETYAQLETIKESIHLRDNLPIIHELGFPVGYPDMDGYTNVNPFGNKTRSGIHCGCDFNKPGNTDLGDTIYAIGDGMIIETYDAYIGILHHMHSKTYPYVISVYYHCNEIFVENNQFVTGGQPIGTIGKKYTKTAHLHFEILTDTTKRDAYYNNIEYCIDPVKFINSYK